MTTLLLVLCAAALGWLARENRELSGRLARTEYAIGDLCNAVFGGPVALGAPLEEEDLEQEFGDYDPEDPAKKWGPN